LRGRRDRQQEPAHVEPARLANGLNPLEDVLPELRHRRLWPRHFEPTLPAEKERFEFDRVVSEKHHGVTRRLVDPQVVVHVER
jgi:hypothetical protein